MKYEGIMKEYAPLYMGRWDLEKFRPSPGQINIIKEEVPRRRFAISRLRGYPRDETCQFGHYGYVEHTLPNVQCCVHFPDPTPSPFLISLSNFTEISLHSSFIT